MNQSKHFECNCVPSLGPPHCHGCSELKGFPTSWDERECRNGKELNPSHDWRDEEENDFLYAMCVECYICSCCFDTTMGCEGEEFVRTN